MSITTWMQVKRLRDLINVDGLTEDDKSNIQMVIDLLEQTENPFARRVAITILRGSLTYNQRIENKYRDTLSTIAKELDQ